MLGGTQGRPWVGSGTSLCCPSLAQLALSNSNEKEAHHVPTFSSGPKILAQCATLHSHINIYMLNHRCDSSLSPPGDPPTPTPIKFSAADVEPG